MLIMMHESAINIENAPCQCVAIAPEGRVSSDRIFAHELLPNENPIRLHAFVSRKIGGVTLIYSKVVTCVVESYGTTLSCTLFAE